jgi:N-acetylglucosamine-6-phosphate deacetylase
MNPARALGIYDTYGSITLGKKGFIVLLDESLEVKRVLGTGHLYNNSNI